MAHAIILLFLVEQINDSYLLLYVYMLAHIPGNMYKCFTHEICYKEKETKNSWILAKLEKKNSHGQEWDGSPQVHSAGCNVYTCALPAT